MNRFLYHVFVFHKITQLPALIACFCFQIISISFLKLVAVVVVLLTGSFRGMGAWQMTLEPQKPGNSPGPGPQVVERERAGKEFVAGQCRMR